MFHRFAKLSLSLALYAIDQGRDVLGLSRRKSTGVVLYYHAVPVQWKETFATQLDLLTKHAEPWSLECTPPNAHHWAGISFDDAYVSVWENAVPELLQRKLPFTVFVATGCLGQRPSWIRSPNHPFWGERVMSVKQIQELSRLPGVTLGSHTVTHARLSRLSQAELDRELHDSKAILEDLTGQPVNLLSFPYGDWNPLVVDRSLAIGYRRLFSIEPVCLNGGLIPTVLGRVSVEPKDSQLEFMLKFKGCYRWTVHTSRLVHRFKSQSI